jgi:diamine N-acetyltransferase
MIKISRASDEHLPILTSIGSKTLHESHGRSAPAHIMNAYVDEKFSEAALKEELDDPNNIFHIIYYNNIPTGYSKIIYNIPIDPVPFSNITKMERLYLLEEFHGLKLGHELMEFNVNLSKQNNQAGMWLYVWKENHRALRFYEKAGFTIVGDGWFRLTEEHSNPNWQMYLEY